MTIQELISLASEKDEQFKREVDYHLNKRRVAPSLKWFMKRLTNILGEDFVRNAAQEEINRQHQIQGLKPGLVFVDESDYLPEETDEVKSLKAQGKTVWLNADGNIVKVTDK